MFKWSFHCQDCLSFFLELISSLLGLHDVLSYNLLFFFCCFLNFSNSFSATVVMTSHYTRCPFSPTSLLTKPSSLQPRYFNIGILSILGEYPNLVFSQYWYSPIVFLKYMGIWETMRSLLDRLKTLVQI